MPLTNYMWSSALKP